MRSKRSIVVKRLAAGVCVAALAAGVSGVAAASQPAQEQPASEAAAQQLIASGATFDDLNAAGVSVLLDEGGKQMFDPHNGHVDFKCADCHSSDGTAAPTLMCNTCHRITLPDGWQNPTYDQSTKPMFVDPGTIYGDLGYGVSGVSYGVPYSNTADEA